MATTIHISCSLNELLIPRLENCTVSELTGDTRVRSDNWVRQGIETTSIRGIGCSCIQDAIFTLADADDDGAMGRVGLLIAIWVQQASNVSFVDGLLLKCTCVG